MELVKIINARNVLRDISDIDGIETHLSYLGAKFLAKTESEYEFYTIGMRKLFEKYAQKKDDDTLIIPSEDVDMFNKAVENLGLTDVEDPGIRFRLSELASGLKLSIKQIYPLLDFIEEDK